MDTIDTHVQACCALAACSVGGAWGGKLRVVKTYTTLCSRQHADHRLARHAACSPSWLSVIFLICASGLLDSSVSFSATPSRMTVTPSWLSGFWSKKSRTNVLQMRSMQARRLGRRSCADAPRERSIT